MRRYPIEEHRTPERDWTEKQGQYLAFTDYSVIHGEFDPEEFDLEETNKILRELW
jgi:hypothetical protein